MIILKILNCINYLHLSVVATVIDRSKVPLHEYISKQRHPVDDLPDMTMICDCFPTAINEPTYSADFSFFLLLFIYINKKCI